MNNYDYSKLHNIIDFLTKIYPYDKVYKEIVKDYYGMSNSTINTRFEMLEEYGAITKLQQKTGKIILYSINREKMLELRKLELGD